jgi:hypothetical protein
MKLFLLALIFCSCNSKKQSPLETALQNGDTALAKKLAQKELDSLRGTIKDSSFANYLDASLHLQTLEFTLEKADTSRTGNNHAEELILNHPNGKRLYELMMKSYKLALSHTSNSSDINYFTNELSQSPEKWLEKKFANKKTYEALISIFLLQKDIALISAIEINTDNDLMRKELDTQYQELINIMRKNY